MKLLRKHIGFVIFLVVALTLLAFLLVLNTQAGHRLQASEEQTLKQQRFLETISSGEFALDDKNIQQANRNQEVAKNAREQLLRTLQRKYAISKRTMSGFECISEVRAGIRELRSLLAQRDIDAPQGMYFSFKEVAQARTLPEAHQVPVILKQLTVVNAIAKAAAESYVTSFDSLERLDSTDANSPYGSALPARGGAQTARYRVKVSGTGQRLQDFLNALNQRDGVLLLVRNVRITRDKQKLGERRRSGTSAPSEEEERYRSRPERFAPDEPSRRTAPRRDRSGRTDQQEEQVGPPTREDREVFANSLPLKATITVGLLEFAAEEETEENRAGTEAAFLPESEQPPDDLPETPETPESPEAPEDGDESADDAPPPDALPETADPPAKAEEDGVPVPNEETTRDGPPRTGD